MTPPRPHPHRRVTRTTTLCILPSAAPYRCSPWAPVAVAAPIGYPPRYILRCSARPEGWDHCVPLLTFLHEHRKDFLRGLWTNVLRAAAVRLVERGRSPRTSASTSPDTRASGSPSHVHPY